MYDYLIWRLREAAKWADKGLAIMPSVCLEAADAIERLSAVVRAQKAVLEKFPRWIPVTERLPEKNGSYLVYVYGDVTEMDFWHGKWHRLRDDYTKAVTHWMPIPTPPEEG